MRVCLPLLLCCATALAAPEPPKQYSLDGVRNDLARSFTLPAALPLDPALRSAADEISAAHIARIQALLPAWLEEENQFNNATGKQAQTWEPYVAVWARMLNELGLWQLEPGDAAYESATLAILRGSTPFCNLYSDARASDYAARIARIQTLPAAQRPAMLAAERELLAHWGKPRATLPAWPQPLPQDAALRLIKTGKPAARPALTPVLASELLGERKPYQDLPQAEQCLLQQWWFKYSLQQGVAPATALNAYRYGTMINVTERLAGMVDQPPAAASGAPVFPTLAARFLAHGASIIEVQLDANGKLQQASMAERKVEVPGIRGVRPVAFETLFDQSALQYAADHPQIQPAGKNPYKFQLLWTMPEAPK
ncbi:hypothetical protein GJ697_12025 [Pseudoduganella sp. FT25W]|uniref:TonB C-terminal domain-containing protein n=1 Tax=Duganella alba TaxID=2666081 RepID=A0A6L5QFN1_9BURK|nr:hypothetical protein [Duganella alba]MRX08567.1 hypothetical protein [Duganella alba]MRX16959.1 hypothetical protein [Duganella alba]